MENEIDGQNEQDGEDEGEEEEAEEAHWFGSLVMGGRVQDAGGLCGSVDGVQGSGWSFGHEDEGFRFVWWVGAAEGDIFGALRCGTEVVSHGVVEGIW